MAITYTQLKTECATDPTAIGLTAPYNSGFDNVVANLLNAVNAGITVQKLVIHNYELFGLTDQTELAALTASNKQLYQYLMSMDSMDPSNANVRSAFTTMFPSGNTHNNVVAFISRTGSRAEQLFGYGIVIVPNDIAQARIS